MTFQGFITSNAVADLGWALLHSLWQITLVAAALLLTLRVLRGHSANLRYCVSVGALLLGLILPVITFVQISTNSPIEAVANSIAEATSRRYPTGLRIEEQPTDSLIQRHGDSAQNITTFIGLRRYLDTQIPNLLTFAVGLWMIGVALFALRLGGGTWQLRVYTTRQIECVEGRWEQIFLSLCEKTGLTQKVRLLSSSLIQTPIAFGIFKPLIIVPASLFLQVHPRELETIIAHELVHIRRYDPLVTVIQSFIETLLFYHPGVWWISKQVNRVREFAADADVLRLFQHPHVTYARALANLEEIRLRADQQLPRLANAANGGHLMQRIERILKIETEVGRATSAWTATLALLLTSAVLLAIFSFNSSGFVNAQSMG